MKTANKRLVSVLIAFSLAIGIVPGFTTKLSAAQATTTKTITWEYNDLQSNTEDTMSSFNTPKVKVIKGVTVTLTNNYNGGRYKFGYDLSTTSDKQSFTFSTTEGKFTKIEISYNSDGLWKEPGTGWTPISNLREGGTMTWTGESQSVVLTGGFLYRTEHVQYIKFTIEVPLVNDSSYESITSYTYDGDEKTSITGTNVSITGTNEATDAGSYTAYVEPASGHAWSSDGSNSKKTVIWEIAKATSNNWTTVAEAQPDWKYDGNERSLFQAVPVPQFGTVQYSFKKDDGAWSDYSSTVPSATDAGTYSVKYKVDETDNYVGIAESSFTVTISKGDNTLTYADQSYSYDYDAETGTTEVLAAASNAQGDVSYSLKSQPSGNYFSFDSSTRTLSIAAGTPAGTYTLVISATTSGNENYSSGSADSTVTVTINAIDMTATSIGSNSVYDGNEYSITVTAPEGSTVKYGETDGVYDLDTNPTYKDAGTYEVYYQVTKDNYVTVTGSNTVVIEPKEAVLSWGDTTLVYNGKEQTPTATVSNLVSGDTCTVTVTDGGKDVGNYTATASGLSNPNYKLPSDVTKDFSIAIKPAPDKDNLSDNEKPAANDLTFADKSQELVSKSDKLPEGYEKIQYSLDGINWSDDIPEGEDAGEYTVKVRYIGDSNHEDFDGEDITVTIAKVPAPTTLDDDNTPAANEDLEYAGKPQELITDPKSLPDGYTKVLYSLDGENWTEDIPTGTDAGTYTVSVKYVGDKNHEDIIGKDITVTIDKADAPAVKPSSTEKPAAKDELKSTGEPQPLVTAPSNLPSGYDEVLYSLDGVNWSKEIPTASAAGTYTVKTKYVSDNYEDLAGEDVTVTILAVYKVTSGNDATWTQGSKELPAFRFSRTENDSETIKHFTGVRLNGALVDSKNYTAKAGSVIVTLNEDYLKTLAAGKYTLTAMFDDGDDVTVTFTIVEAAASTNNAATSTNNAATSANNAATSANNAATSANNAATSTNNAATSTNNAATSTNNAATSTNNSSAAASVVKTGENISVTAFAGWILVMSAGAVMYLVEATKKRKDNC